jgi:hypothetical protein
MQPFISAKMKKRITKLNHSKHEFDLNETSSSLPSPDPLIRYKRNFSQNIKRNLRIGESKRSKGNEKYGINRKQRPSIGKLFNLNLFMVNNNTYLNHDCNSVSEFVMVFEFFIAIIK